jgi:PBP1b-binding outer membrane lipoprotein LpoB
VKLQSKKIVLGVLVLLIFGCRRNSGLPEDVIPQEQMVPIIADLQMIETAVARLNLQSYDSAKVAFQYLQLRTLKKYGVDSSSYRKSFEAYARHPAHMEEIYSDVLKILEAKSDSALLEDRMSRPTDENPPQ